ncbi:MAG: STAS domain-containing protein [Chloroherpetonaceae bacterium]|nr:STAS domain-containing protein [Chloroherpetonaceae bacterium]MCS7211135.1 STAS domain-containing protein [Chloroherpetonaceae bacterium]MDW8020951.1 STAS domain-containing protein [Chloroherpetonaceae bacterium]MDW8465568.1 STAS domain-containing protein [Chloroherpetonaceae bacterium]
MATFTSTVRTVGAVTVIDLSGDLDAHTSVQLERTIQDLIQKKHFNLIINFSNLNYISSAGLGVFMAFIDDVRANGGDIKFSNMPEKIYQIFDLLGFPMLYEIYKDEREAIEKFKTSATT